VTAGYDAADNEIVRRCAERDLVVIDDIPLAAQVLDKGAYGLDFRGERYSPETIQDRLNRRDFMKTLRASAIQTGGPAAPAQAGRQAFAEPQPLPDASHARTMGFGNLNGSTPTLMVIPRRPRFRETT